MNGNISFFDLYPEFYEHSNGNLKERLRHRYDAIIEWNREYISNKTIFDIGAHDGRWSFAALMNGAKYCECIEPRYELIKIGRNIFDKYNLLGTQCSFSKNTLAEWFQLQPKRKYDVGFCLGYLYHTYYHYDLLSKMFDYCNTIILDTRVIKPKNSLIMVRREDKSNQLSTFNEDIVATPSVSAIELYLGLLDCEWEYYDWDSVQYTRECGDYRDGKRVTMRITKR